jgi:hypothetical protein
MTQNTTIPAFDFDEDETKLRAPKLKPAPFFMLNGSDVRSATSDYEVLCRANTRLVLSTVEWRVVRRRFAGWFYRFIPQMLISLARHGAATSRVTGRSLAGQAADMTMLANRTSMMPSEYYEFGLARFGGGAELRNFIPPRFYFFVALACGKSRRSSIDNPPDFKDKAVFESHCRKLGEPSVRTVAIIGDRQVFGQDGVSGLRHLPDIDLFVKPKRGEQGRKTMMFRSLGSGSFRSNDGTVMAGEAVIELLLERAQEARRSLLVQQALRNSAFVEELAGKALATTRIITIRNEVDEPEVVFACFRTAGSAHSIVDNYHASGIAFALDINTGELGAGRKLNFAQSPRFHDIHPVTGKMMKGTKLPQWPEAKALALRLHGSSPHLLVCGWDIAFTENGPCVIEANLPPGTPVVQMQKGFLGTRYSQLLAMHARKWLEAEKAETKP